MKTLPLFLKDCKLFGAVMPEKPDVVIRWTERQKDTSISVTEIANEFSSEEHFQISDYERSKSEALSQAMECVNPELMFETSEDGEWLVRDESTRPTSFHFVKEGEFYSWEGEYCIVEKYCGGKNCPVNDGCWGGVCVFPNKSTKLLPMSNVTEETSATLKQRNLLNRAKWVAYCIEIGFADKSQIEDLEAIWDKFKNPNGSLKSPSVETETQEQFARKIWNRAVMWRERFCGPDGDFDYEESIENAFNEFYKNLKP